MSRQKAWFNIHAQGVKQYQQTVDAHRDFQPAWSLIMDGYGLIKDCRAVSPNTNYIQRSYKPDGWWLKYPADTILAQIDKELGEDYQTWWYVENEVGLQAQYFIKLIEANAKRDRPRRIAIINASVGTPDVDEWRTHDGKKLLRLIAKYKDWCVLCLHEYFLALIATGLQDQHIIPNPADWPALLDPAKNNWLCGRFWFVIKLCRELGIEVRFVLTEFGPDAIAALEKAVGKLDGGWRNAQPWWRQYLPGLTDEECIYMMTYYMIEVICKDSWVEGVLWYCLWHIDSRWYNYDVAPLLPNLLNLLKAWQVPKRLPQLARPTPQPEPEPEVPIYVPKPDNASRPVQHRVVKPALRNVRSGPGTNYPDNGDVLAGDIITVYDVPTVVDSTSRIWKWMEKPANGTKAVAGWICITGMTFQSPTLPWPKPDTQPIPPVEQPAPAPNWREFRVMVYATDEEASEISTAVLQFLAGMSKLQEILRGVQPRIEIIEVNSPKEGQV